MTTKRILLPKWQLNDLYYEQNLSLAEIAEVLGISIHKVRYWMEKHHIPARNRSDALYIKLNPNGDPFKIKTRLSKSELKLKYLTLGLFWGEGDKVNKNSLKVTNTDPALLKNFLLFLTEICQLKSYRIAYYLQTFKDIKTDQAISFWSTHLNIDSRLIKVSKPIPSQGKGTYKRINLNGVLSIVAFNTKLRSYMFNELEKLGFSNKSAISHGKINIKPR